MGGRSVCRCADIGSRMRLDHRGEGGGYFTKIFGNWVLHTIKNWTQLDLRFCKNEGQKNLRSMKKGSIGLKINEKIDLYKMLKTVK